MASAMPGISANRRPVSPVSSLSNHDLVSFNTRNRLASAPLDADLTRDWVRPLASKAVRRDLAKLARGVQPNMLLEIYSRLSKFTGPVRIVWGEDDPFFRTELGRRLSEVFPHANLTTVPGGRTFLPLDHPDEVAGEIVAALQRV